MRCEHILSKSTEPPNLAYTKAFSLAHYRAYLLSFHSMAPKTRQSTVSYARGWGDARELPVLAWMEKYTVETFNNPAVLKNKEAFAKWHTADFVYNNSDGTKYDGFEAAYAAIQQIYTPFAGFSHEPSFFNCWETEEGWEMVGTATMYADLPVPGGEKTNEDLHGKKWDLGLPGMFHFWYVKDDSGPGGFKMKRSDVFSDTFPAVQEMVKRGMIKL
jgi:hypothetical protein